MNVNTPIFSQNDLINAWNLIKKARTITLLTHYKPDGDGISACAALEMILNTFDPSKKIETIYPTPPEVEAFHNPKNILINQRATIPEIIVAFDTAHYDRLYYPDAFKKIPLINIDHHISNSINGIYNFVNAKAASTCELLYELFIDWCPDEITTPVAEALLYGILYDTQTFQTQSTTAQSLAIASSLIEKGASLYNLQAAVFKPKSYATIVWWGKLLTTLNRNQSGNAVWSVITSKDFALNHTTAEDLSGFNNFLARFVECDIIAIAYEVQENVTKLSFRSKVSDVNALAKQFNGGGHKNAAGALCNQPIGEVGSHLQKLLETL